LFTYGKYELKTLSDLGLEKEFIDAAREGDTKTLRAVNP
jgi:hypothetical protein